MIEKTLVMIKPGNFDYALEIFSCLEDLLDKTGMFKKLFAVHIDGIDRNIIEEFYGPVKKIGLEIYEETVRAFVEKDVIVSIYEGENIVGRVRKAIGNTAPEKAEEGTVRNVFRKDSLQKALKEKRYLNNVIHASGSRSDAEKEIELLGKYLD